MLLKEKGKLVSDEKQLASIMNKLFINITKSLNLKEDQVSPPPTLEDILQKNVFNRVLTRPEKKKFSFQQVTEENLGQVIDGSQATLLGDIPGDMLKVTLDIYLLLITKIIENGCFPEDLQFAEVSPIFKKNDVIQVLEKITALPDTVLQIRFF